MGKIFGPAGVLGLAPLAIIGAMTNSNSGVYASLAGQYGDASDVSAVTILSLNDGPFFTMLVFGMTGLSNIPFMSLVAVLVPALIGMLLGNLDPDMKEFMKAGLVITIPAASFPLGASLNFFTAIGAGAPGIILGLLTLLLTGLVGYFASAIFGGKPRPVGAAIGTVAGNAVATPMALAAVDPTLEQMAQVATAQIAAAVLVTAILCPMLVYLLDKWSRQKEATLQKQNS